MDHITLFIHELKEEDRKQLPISAMVFVNVGSIVYPNIFFQGTNLVFSIVPKII